MFLIKGAQTEKNRLLWVDFIKGFMIILVVLSHACVPAMRNENMYINKLYDFLYSFYMPIFYLLSGYMFHLSHSSEDNKWCSKMTFVYHKFKKLMIPYFLYLSIVYIVFIVTRQIPLLNSLLIKAGYNNDITVKTIIMDVIFCLGKVDKHLWFIYVLFIVSVISEILYGIVKPYILSVVSILILSMLIILFKFTSSSAGGIYFKCLYYLFFFSLGAYVNILKAILVRIIWVTLPFFLLFEYYFLYSLNTENLLLRNCVLIVVSLLACLIIIGIAQKKYNTVPGSLLIWIGKQSFIIYLLHQPFITSGVSVILYLLEIPILGCILGGLTAGILIPLVVNAFIVHIRRRNWHV